MRRVLLLIVPVMLALSACSLTASEPVKVAAGDGPTSGDARELLDALAYSRTLTFNARYAARSDDPEMGKANLTVEVWRKPPYLRQDAVTVDQNAQTESVTIAKDGFVQCTRQDRDPWGCTRLDENAAAGFGDLVAAVEAEIAGALVRRLEQTTKERRFVCYMISRPAHPPSEICLDDDGIPIRIASAGSRLDLTSLTMKVSDNVFTPPAPVA